MTRREWYTPAEIVAARSPDLPGTVRNINALADANHWRADPARARKRAGQGGGWEYHLSLLPAGAQARLLLLHGNRPEPEPTNDAAASAALWARFEGLSKTLKDECARRLGVIDTVEQLIAAGATETTAVSEAGARHGVSARTVWSWRGMVADVAAADRLAALAPAYAATATRSDCHPKAWEVLLADWLRLEAPRFSACYRRARKLASKNGWLPFPSERALRRRLEAEVPAAVATLARKGAKKAKTLYPAQQRTRIHLHAMQAVNMDGHELDVFVRTPDGRVLRMHLLALQDLYSGKIVAWRLAETENKETVRLAIGDMVEAYGIPDTIVLDNGRAFASKWISGGTPNRYRFKVREGDPQGLLTALKVEIVWAKPYSGQSKPIERAFGDLAENIAKHPFCAGAYTGNRPEAKPENYGSRAIPLDDFRAHVDEQIAEHNARPGRSLESCAGRSFDEAFAASMEAPGTIVRWPTDAQRSLWMLAAEKIRCRKGSGEIHFLENRYWSAELNQHAGKQVIVRFDPDHLHGSVRVYTLADEFICVAPCFHKAGFFNQDEARVHSRNRASYLKALKEHERLRDKLTADELARLYAPSGRPAPAEKQPPKVKRLATAGVAAGAAPAMDDIDFEDAFGRGLRLIVSNDD